MVHCGGGSFKSQFKRADKSGAKIALILGEDEINRGVLSVKPLRGQGEQQEFSQEALIMYLKHMLPATEPPL